MTKRKTIPLLQPYETEDGRWYVKLPMLPDPRRFDDYEGLPLGDCGLSCALYRVGLIKKYGEWVKAQST